MRIYLHKSIAATRADGKRDIDGSAQLNTQNSDWRRPQHLLFVDHLTHNGPEQRIIPVFEYIHGLRSANTSEARLGSTNRSIAFRHSPLESYRSTAFRHPPLERHPLESNKAIDPERAFEPIHSIETPPPRELIPLAAECVESIKWKGPCLTFCSSANCEAIFCMLSLRRTRNRLHAFVTAVVL